MRWPAIFCLLASGAGFAQTEPPSPQAFRPPQGMAPEKRGVSPEFAAGISTLSTLGGFVAGGVVFASGAHASADAGPMVAGSAIGALALIVGPSVGRAVAGDGSAWSRIGVRLLLVTGTVVATGIAATAGLSERAYDPGVAAAGGVAAGIGFAATLIHAGWDIATTPRDLRARAASASPVLVASRDGKLAPGIGWTF
ncbi:MAG: hypothetical protein ACJ78U_17180 [Myxococcales bacterium]